MDEHVEFPIHEAAFIELVGLVYDASIILQDELEDGRRTPLDKFDKYFYERICDLLRNDGRLYIPFK